ncbi:MAG: CAP domain-containing protein [Pseudonocardia sp.]
MTTRRHRRTAPVLVGLSTGAVMAVVAVLLGQLHHPAAQQPTASDVTGLSQDGRSGPTAQQPPLPPSTLPPSTPPGPTPPGPRPTTVVALPLFLPGLPPYLPALLPKLPASLPTLPGRPRPAVPKPTNPAVPGLSGPAAVVVVLTNAERAKAGCGPLKVDSRLNTSAQRHSVDMATRDYFEHEDPDGHDFADREAAAGFTGDSGGENIAMGQTSAAEVMNDWMHSPGHRRNILDCSFTSIGVGYVAAGHYWTQNFGG